MRLVFAEFRTLAATVWLLGACGALRAQDPADSVCPRPLPGSTVQAPPELRSHDGVLETTLHFRSAFDERHLQRFCYVTDDGLLSPTLRVHPGDLLLIHFRNELKSDVAQQTGIPQAEHPRGGDMPMPKQHGPAASPPRSIPGQTLPSRDNPDDAPCFTAGMSARGTNLHFHGMGVPPVCHQDDVLRTLVLAGQSFDYRVHVPADEAPGLYWYHPHGHGYSEAQVLGGASGAIIVETSEVSELPERTLVLRDRLVTEGTAEAHKSDKDLPTWDPSLNFVPVLYPEDKPARLELPAARRELWRIVNAGADLNFDLQYLVEGKPQPFAVRALDGVPLRDSTGGLREETRLHLLPPPGARAEAVVLTPKPGEHAELRTLRVDTGPDGETEPPRRIALLLAGRTTYDGATANAGDVPTHGPVVNHTSSVRAGEPLYQRKLYFSERAMDPNNKEGYVQFFLTVEGHAPKQYGMGQPPDITVHQGSVEQWTVENRARELHVFHIHQLHFRVTAVNGVPTNDDALRDTVPIDYWKGSGPYPSVTVELDFRSRALIGTFVYHCHILGHEDAGMMGGIEVLPHGAPSTIMLKNEGGAWVAHVTSSGLSAAPIGTVQFRVRGGGVADVPLRNGTAVMPAALLSGPSFAPSALYSGDRFSDPSSTQP